MRCTYHYSALGRLVYVCHIARTVEEANTYLAEHGGTSVIAETPRGILIANTADKGLPRRAWTGGERPKRWCETGHQERAIAREYFRNAMQVSQKLWRDSRGLADTMLDNARTHWTHARYDAYETVREVQALAERIGMTHAAYWYVLAFDRASR